MSMHVGIDLVCILNKVHPLCKDAIAPFSLLNLDVMLNIFSLKLNNLI